MIVRLKYAAGRTYFEVVRVSINPGCPSGTKSTRLTWVPENGIWAVKVVSEPKTLLTST